MLDSRYLVACRTVVFGELRLNNHLWIELVWNNKIRRLVESGEALRPVRLSKADSLSRKHILDSVLDEVSDQFTD